MQFIVLNKEYLKIKSIKITLYFFKTIYNNSKLLYNNIIVLYQSERGIIMDSFVDFKLIKSKIKTQQNYIKRNCETIGGMWTVDTWENNGIIYQVMDEGYTERIFIPEVLDVIKNYNNDIVFKIGSENILNTISKTFF